MIENYNNGKFEIYSGDLGEKYVKRGLLGFKIRLINDKSYEAILKKNTDFYTSDNNDFIEFQEHLVFSVNGVNKDTKAKYMF